MNKLIYPIAVLAVMVTSAFVVMRSQNWKVANHYSVKFSCGDASGEFSGLEGTLNFAPADLASSKFEVSIDATAINTGNGTKNRHIKSANWIDAEKYPFITFTSSHISQTAKGYEAKGMLELHGVKKEVIIPFTFINNIFSGSFTINRIDYNINSSDKDDDQSVRLELSVPVSRL